MFDRARKVTTKCQNTYKGVKAYFSHSEFIFMTHNTFVAECYYAIRNILYNDTASPNHSPSSNMNSLANNTSSSNP